MTASASGTATSASHTTRSTSSVGRALFRYVERDTLEGPLVSRTVRPGGDSSFDTFGSVILDKGNSLGCFDFDMAQLVAVCAELLAERVGQATGILYGLVAKNGELNNGGRSKDTGVRPIGVRMMVLVPMTVLEIIAARGGG